MEYSMLWTVQVTWGQLLSYSMMALFFEPARMLSSDDSIKVLEDSTAVLCIGGDDRIL
jgi:hypothetical protein